MILMAMIVIMMVVTMMVMVVMVVIVVMVVVVMIMMVMYVESGTVVVMDVIRLHSRSQLLAGHFLFRDLGLGQNMVDDLLLEHRAAQLD